jgi:hypothetical protein
MNESLVEKINSAINQCLDEFYASRKQPASLARFIAGLRTDPNWEEWEVREVEEAVRHTAELIAG